MLLTLQQMNVNNKFHSYVLLLLSILSYIHISNCITKKKRNQYTSSSQDPSPSSTEIHIPKGRLFRAILHALALLGVNATPIPSTHTPKPPVPPFTTQQHTQPHVPAVHE